MEKKTPICRFWLQNRCNRDSCRFSHNPADNELCRYWLKDDCRYGSSCKFKHDLSECSQLSLTNTSDTSIETDFIGLVLLKYYLDAVFHLSNIKFSSDLIALLASYVSDLHHTTVPRINSTIVCPLCHQLRRDFLRCAVCHQIQDYYNLVYLDNETDPFILCTQPSCSIRIGMTLHRQIPHYPEVGTIDKPHQPLKLHGHTCCSGFVSLNSDLTIDSCQVTEMLNPKSEITNRQLRTASFFNFKPFNGVLIFASKYELRQIFPCTCITSLEYDEVDGEELEDYTYNDECCCPRCNPQYYI